MILDFVVYHHMKQQQVIFLVTCISIYLIFFFKYLVGSSAHLTSFYGTDTIAGCVLTRNYYLATEMSASSIPASEHSTMVSWTRGKEREAYENMLGLFS